MPELTQTQKVKKLRSLLGTPKLSSEERRMIEAAGLNLDNALPVTMSALTIDKMLDKHFPKQR